MADSIILAVDSATDSCSVALLRGGSVFERRPQAGQKASEVLFALLAGVLADGACRREDISAVAFGSGPGMFSGLRVACGVAQGLCWGLDVPALPVCSLRAVAAGAGQKAGTRILSAIDARMHEIYCGVYEATDDPMNPREILEPSLARPEGIEALVREYRCALVAGNAVLEYAPALEGLAVPREAISVDAALIARIAATDLAAGKGIPAMQAAPLYVRNRVALTIEERSRGEKL